jgi:DNA-directed RNA polymerase subunit RPC12/RpoP
MEEQDYISRQDARIREKQATCLHPSFKCSICGKYIDNLLNEQQAEIEILHLIIGELQKKLTIHSIPFVAYTKVINHSIIDTYRNEKMKEYICKRCTPEILK